MKAGGYSSMGNEKQRVALTSVIAAVFLTIIKIVAGVATGSLGILSEAAHSALDLGAAIVTYFAVRMSDKPADREHNYGHGKIESFSALIETALLLVTCGWIIYEAFERLFLGETVSIDKVGVTWGTGIMVLSIFINISRARALKKTAKKYGSQALEADALHFDSDVWSSLVVIGGLVCVGIGEYFNLNFLSYGDPIAALGVSVLVIAVSVKLGKRTIDVLLDTAPKGMVNEILNAVNSVNGVLDVDNVRIRPSGAHYFIDLGVGINRNESHRVVHSIVHDIRQKITVQIPNSDIVISTFPVDISGAEDREAYHVVKRIVDRFPVCTNIHNIFVYEVSGKKHIAIHLEIRENLSLKASHRLSHEIEDMIRNSIDNVEAASVNFEYVPQKCISARDVTQERRDMVNDIESLIRSSSSGIDCHDIRIYSQGEKYTVFLHCEFNDSSYEVEKTEAVIKSLCNILKISIKQIESVHIHVEPVDNNQEE